MVTSKSEPPALSTESDRSAEHWGVVLQLGHDINNLLGAIVGYSEMLAEDNSADASISPDLLRILESAQRASKLVAMLMIHARQARAEEAERE